MKPLLFVTTHEVYEGLLEDVSRSTPERYWLWFYYYSGWSSILRIVTNEYRLFKLRTADIVVLFNNYLLCFRKKEDNFFVIGEEDESIDDAIAVKDEETAEMEAFALDTA